VWSAAAFAGTAPARPSAGTVRRAVRTAVTSRLTLGRGALDLAGACAITVNCLVSDRSRTS
jgi:hypothetical protein